MKINIFYNTAMSPYYKRTGAYKAAAKKALGKTAARKGELSIIFTGEKEIKDINRRFLNHNYVTDVISFNYPFDNKKQYAPFGDVFVCFAQAKKQAKEMRHGILFEAAVLVAHGVLHLAGYEDDTPQKRAAMNKKAEIIARECL